MNGKIHNTFLLCWYNNTCSTKLTATCNLTTLLVCVWSITNSTKLVAYQTVTLSSQSSSPRTAAMQEDDVYVVWQ